MAVRRVSTLIERENPPRPSVLKIDAEDAEGAILRAACASLPADLIVSISIHKLPDYLECKRVLDELGFRTFPSTELRRRLQDQSPEEWRGVRELLAVGPGRVLSDEALASLSLFSDSSAEQ